ncbi:MAG: YbhB/YbcL family Raf kinase inhibitor-like protein [Verrucomicrobiota bacterium]
MLELTVLSTAFVMGAVIPPKFTCKGENVSPPLMWGQVPDKTQSIVVMCDDPDSPGGDWVHWLLFNLPPETQKLDENVPRTPQLVSGAIQGLNDYDKNGYMGPCPPPGRPHRYYYKVYALDIKLSLTISARKPDVLEAMEGHVLGQGQLMGTFKR